ncbi:MAG: hypothetical protein QNJ40_20385 [Xanthomonadales bacterium]|nr:hypothetical protein [Xanthomonadales bacterium]
MAESEFGTVFSQLRQLLQPYEARLRLVHDRPDSYYLDTRHIMKNGKPLYFGSVQTRKNYVAFHLMPVYVTPALLDDISPALKRRMQGKSCFNFVRPEAALLEELGKLVRRGYDSYAGAGYVEELSP